MSLLAELVSTLLSTIWDVLPIATIVVVSSEDTPMTDAFSAMAESMNFSGDTSMPGCRVRRRKDSPARSVT